MVGGEEGEPLVLGHVPSRDPLAVGGLVAQGFLEGTKFGKRGWMRIDCWNTPVAALLMGGTIQLQSAAGHRPVADSLSRNFKKFFEAV